MTVPGAYASLSRHLTLSGTFFVGTAGLKIKTGNDGVVDDVDWHTKGVDTGIVFRFYDSFFMCVKRTFCF